MKGEKKVSQPDNWLTDWNGTFVKGGYFVNVEDWQEVTNDWYEIWNMDFSKDIDLSDWNPTDKGTTFLQNFLEHICQRLANRTGQTKLTLTLSAAVYTAIMTDNDIKAELVARNWKVTDGTNNYNN